MPKKINSDLIKEWEQAHEELQPYILGVYGVIFVGLCLIGVRCLFWGDNPPQGKFPLNLNLANLPF